MTSKGIVWVTGCRGFLGGEMVERFERAGYNVVGTDVELSVCEPERLEAFAEEVQPSIVVNCAGIRREATTLSTRVKAYEVNALGARNVALAANTVGATIVQVSSDDVYSAKLDEPVNEFDSPEPDTPYGKSKRAGEMMVRNTTNDHIIVRSSWLYHASSGRMKAILDAAREGGTIEVRTDQFAAPTSVSLYADLIFRALDKGATGTFHIVSRGRASRYDFAAKILEYAGYDPEKVLIPVEDPRTAENIVLESMLLDIAGIELPTWEDDLKAYMEEQGLLA
ncbi:MAG TPA: NAD(P)-dependent oxidoreductase [Candidatus Aveggerthella stercoripullorum]|uniref:dTDP-4-dehydrorhamnose reductase n=1 Tax=Candidatus Aveggerthella stercoripullorum TaxID=2840688 RepID=A0A9D1A208_9ACTN|nr:NAD(P)-dependent oxidoreductase [Candidatus Aveggerthella stercoripullorum]